MHIYSNNLNEVIWLAGIRSEHGIFIYSAGQGLTLYKIPQQPPHQPEWNCIFCGLTRAFFALSQMIYLAPNGYSTLAQLRQERNLFLQIFFFIIIIIFLFGFYGPFKNISLISSRSFIKCGWKQENPRKNHLTIQKQNLAFLHVTRARLEPQRWET